MNKILNFNQNIKILIAGDICSPNVSFLQHSFYVFIFQAFGELWCGGHLCCVFALPTQSVIRNQNQIQIGESIYHSSIILILVLSCLLSKSSNPPGRLMTMNQPAPQCVPTGTSLL